MTRRPHDHHLRWAAQTVTFYAPAHWGFTSGDELHLWALSHPREFWDALLDQIAEAGVDRLELCFEPGDWRTLLNAYDNPTTVLDALGRRRLTLAGSYQGGGHRLEAAIRDASVAGEMVEEVREHARFVAACGGSLVLSGPPRRFPFTCAYDGEVPGDVFDSLGSVLESMGAATAEEGVSFGVHTEAYSCVARHTDVAAVLERTDSSLVSLCVDAGHVTLDGGEPARMIRDTAERLCSVHWKDCAGPRASLPVDGEVTHEMMMEQFRTAGQGIVDWRDVTSALAEVGFDGTAAAESDLASDPIAETWAVLQFFDTDLARIYR